MTSSYLTLPLRTEQECRALYDANRANDFARQVNAMSPYQEDIERALELMKEPIAILKDVLRRRNQEHMKFIDEGQAGTQRGRDLIDSCSALMEVLEMTDDINTKLRCAPM